MWARLVLFDGEFSILFSKVVTKSTVDVSTVSSVVKSSIQCDSRHIIRLVLICDAAVIDKTFSVLESFSCKPDHDEFDGMSLLLSVKRHPVKQYTTWQF